MKNNESNKEIPLQHNLIQNEPSADQIKFQLGHYKIIDLIGKGGMGEVFLAYDTICCRNIALKKIRSNLLDHKQVHSRFLKEAHVTSQLIHPSIIPIYSIHKEEKEIYYTMPYVQGETLKEIFKNARKLTQKGKKVDPHIGSIPSLIRIFINVCQAIAYAHSKKVLHRDLKPENVIVGPYGEVLILDWGLATLIKTNEEEEIEIPQGSHLGGITRLGKVVGTVNYMAPERARGNTSTYQTDIYSLGVILYQILTLKYPFIRGGLEEYRKKQSIEIIQDPIEIAPYREIPRILSNVALKCLDPNPENRYQSVDELIKEIESYIEGRAEWFHIATLNPQKKEDWEFQEHIYLSHHIAITHLAEGSDWMTLMISKASFSENILLEAKVCLHDDCYGIGFLFSIPESSERKYLNDGYCLWMGSEKHRATKLMRSTMEVIYAPEIVLRHEEWYDVRIDKNDNIIHFYLNKKLQFSYISHLPFLGTHVGLISKDFNFEIEDFNVYIGGQNVMVKCLAVPDAFLAFKKYEIALSEYRRIGYSFPGRAEGREALFRAGITLLEQAKNVNIDEAQNYYELALKEFEKLYKTAGAPFEYLGKALVYQSMHEYDEEIKCFELGCRKYYKHPLISILHEQILFRMHECSRIHRKATFQFILLTTRLLPEAALSKHVKKLFESLQKHWESLPFIEIDEEIQKSIISKKILFSIKLAFWLGRPLTIEEILQDLIKNPCPQSLMINGLICIIKLGSVPLAEKILNGLDNLDEEAKEDLRLIIETEKHFNIEPILKYIQKRDSTNFSFERTILHIVELALDLHLEKEIYSIYLSLKHPFQHENQIYLDAYLCWILIYKQRWEESSKIFQKYPLESLTQETSLLYTVYGCWLLACEGKEIAQIHFSSILDTSFPKTFCLLGHYLNRRFQDNQIWLQRAFSWEKRQLYRQLQLYFHIVKNHELEETYSQLEKQEKINVN